MPDRLRAFLRPREGWLSLALLFVALLSLGWSIQRAEWLDHLDFLVPVSFYAVLAGALLGLSRLSVVITLPASAALGAGIVLWTVGGEYFADMGQAGRLLALRSETIDWIRIVADGGYAPQEPPYAVALGVLMWVTAFIAGYTTYRHHRVIDAVLLVGATLVVNLSATVIDLFGYMVLFAMAALLLWLRAALIGREEGWHRRRVNENPEVPVSIMRSGVTFIAGSIGLAWVLTTVAVAAPLTGVWNNLDGVWSDVQGELEGIFGGLATTDSRITGVGFGSRFTVSGTWFSDDAEVMTVASQRAYYMRTITYDIYTGHGWSRTDGPERRVAAGERVFPGYTPERPLAADAFEIETVTVQAQDRLGRAIFTPGYPTGVLSPILVQELDGRPLLGGLKSASSINAGEGYQITAAISRATEAELAGAGGAYPPDILAYYLGTEGVTDRTRALARAIVEQVGAETPYHRARALANYLQRDPRFSYSNLAALPTDPGSDLVDFFLFDERGQVGYCEYFASSMAVMARSLGIPARIAVGYAPGERLEDGIYQYRSKNAHAWAEIYFPGYGWQIFESTKSIAPVIRISGSGIVPPVVDPVRGLDDPGPFLEGEDLGTISNLPSFEPVAGGYRAGEEPPTDEARGGNALIVLSIVGLLLAIGTWRLLRGRRHLRFLAPGDRQWQSLALAADRAGVAPRPSETIYEYAAWLEEQLPARRREIRTIADGKVWQSYSGRSISAEAIALIERAWRRLQLPLVWLTLRRRLAALLPRRARP